MKGKIILLNGVSSSGKSTLAQKMTELMPDYLLISLDDIGDLMWKMRNKKRNPSTSELCVESNFEVSLKPYLFHRIISLVHDYSYNIIVDAVIDSAKVLKDLTTIFQDNEIIFVAVHCPIQELERREKARGDRPAGHAKSQLENFHKNIKYNVEVDTFSNTIDECALKIIEFIKQ